MVDHYTYRNTWSAEGREHLGLCAEFSSLSWLAPTPARALVGIRELVGQVVEDMCINHEVVPSQPVMSSQDLPTRHRVRGDPNG